MSNATVVEDRSVQLNGDVLRIERLQVANSEAAAFVREVWNTAGPEAAEELVRRAVVVGLVAVNVATPTDLSGSINRTLHAFATELEHTSQDTIRGLRDTLRQLQAGERAVEDVAGRVLQSLPEQVDRALGAQAGSVAANVRTAVVEATHAVQANALQELRAALELQSQSVRASLAAREAGATDLRRELLDSVAGTRRELAAQLSAVHALLASQQAASTAGAKSTRQVGQAFEDLAVSALREAVAAAGDVLEATGSTPAPGGGKTGDAVIEVISPTVSRGHQIKLVAEAKGRTMSLKALRQEVAKARKVREAIGGLVLVPAGAVPGGGRMARLDELSWVCDVTDPEAVSMTYLVLRETAVWHTLRHNSAGAVDLSRLAANLTRATTLLTEWDEVARLANNASRSLEQLKKAGGTMKASMQELLADTLNQLQA